MCATPGRLGRLVSKMVDDFPYGKAPFWLVAVAVGASLLRLFVATAHEKRADLVFVTHSLVHYDTYKEAIPEFERRYGVDVRLQFSHWSALQNRLQNAMLAGAEVPDMFEVVDQSLGYFTRGPRKDIEISDLTDRIRADGLDRRLVGTRFSSWSTADKRIFALPHDVHPVMLAYRRDLVEALGIDVQSLDTWDKFVEAGRRVTRDLDGDGIPDRYMLELPPDGNWGLVTLLLQRGGQMFDPEGNVAFDSDLTADLFAWYIRQSFGPERIAYDAGWGQTLGRTMTDGLVLFYVTPDWRSGLFENEIPGAKGKMALMPLPAWTKGGRRTSVWGGTGLMISRRAKDPDLAWKLATYLYFDPRGIGERFIGTNIIPVLKEAWNLPELDRPNAYFSNQPLGRLYADLAPDVPPYYSSAMSVVAQVEIDEAFTRSAEHYRRFGETDLLPTIHAELARAEAYVRRRAQREAALDRGD